MNNTISALYITNVLIFNKTLGESETPEKKKLHYDILLLSQISSLSFVQN